MKPILTFATSCLLLGAPAIAATPTRPNILWIVVDDMSADFSCYGEKVITTPAVDKLAAEGLRFTRAYATAPVCSAFRSSLITGMYQTSIGAHHHRSGRGERRIHLPTGVRPVPELFREAGYWTCIGSGLPGIDHRSLQTHQNRQGKTDYNFEWKPAIYDSHDWAGRSDDQPFFMQVQLHGGKLRGENHKASRAFAMRAAKELGSATDPAAVQLPSHYPDDPVFRTDWAAYLDSVRMTDDHVGKVVSRLKTEGLLDHTLIIFFTDHGISSARGKQFLYDEGTHIPLVLRGPGIEPGGVRHDLVEHIDIAALSLAAAGIPIPEIMQGDDTLAPGYQPKDAVFAARDRCGETTDRIRSVRTDRYLYLRNFHPKRPHLQPNLYKDSKDILIRLRELHAEGKLPAPSERTLFAPQRTQEELYLYREDRWQHSNLAADPAHADALRAHRERLDRWITDTGDPGPETPEIHALEIEDQLRARRANDRKFRENLKQIKRWADEGK